MKKLTFLLLFVTTACTAQNTTITGRIGSLPDGAKIELRNAATYLRETAFAETQVADGQFVFTIEMDGPRMLTIDAGPEHGNFDLIATPAETIILTGPTLRDADVAGSQWQQKFTDLTEKPRLDYAAKVKDLSDEERAPLFEEYLNYLKRLTAENSGTFLGPLLIHRFSRNIAPTEAAWEALSESARNSFHGRALRAHLDRLFPKDKPAPAFTLKDRDGREFALTDLLAGKKYLLIDFWASWCLPCRKGIPKLKEYAKKYATDGLAIVNISTDTNRAAWLRALDREQMPWTNLLDAEGKTAAAYGVRGIPTAFLIDADGIIRSDDLSNTTMEQRLREVFGY